MSLLVRPPLLQWVDWLLVLTGATTLASVAALVAIGSMLRSGSVRGHTDWQRLDRLAPELVGQTDEAAILRIALADAPWMFRCGRVEVRLEEAAHRPPLVAYADASTTDSVEVHGTTPEDRAEDPDAFTLPLLGPGGEIGRITFSFYSSSFFSRRSHVARERLARAFAHALSSSLGAAHALGEERRLVEVTTQRATQDDLTSLGNRWLLDQWGDHLLTIARSQGKTAAVLLFDADDFKEINDVLGHEGGDRVLAEYGRRIHRCVRDTDLAVRLGGDEFAILTGDLRTAEDAEKLAERVLAELAEPHVVDDVELTLLSSVGIAICDADGDSVASLLRAADHAMYAAKAAGSGLWRRATEGSGEIRVDEQGRITSDLRDGLLEKQLLLHYQPQVDARTGEVRGFEAFARWQHPELGLLTPAEFVPLAERSGLMRQLTSSVLDQVLTDRARFEQSVPGARLSVNVSARNLLGQGLVEDVARLLEKYDVPPFQLTLEVSEPAAGSESSVAEVFQRVEDLGCRISVSEYGTGQSSLTALAHLPGIREVKISPGLVAQMPAVEAGRRLVDALTTAAHSLRVEVVAEGVESVQLAEQLRALGCDTLQGFHIHEPAPLEDIIGWVAWWSVQRHERLGLGGGSAVVGRG